MMWGQSIRGLLGVAPSMDVRFYGFTFRWFGVGVVWMRSGPDSPVDVPPGFRGINVVQEEPVTDELPEPGGLPPATGPGVRRES
jgi:hypothetical protein